MVVYVANRPVGSLDELISEAITKFVKLTIYMINISWIADVSTDILTRV